MNEYPQYAVLYYTLERSTLMRLDQPTADGELYYVRVSSGNFDDMMQIAMTMNNKNEEKEVA